MEPDCPAPADGLTRDGTQPQDAALHGLVSTSEACPLAPAIRWLWTARLAGGGLLVLLVAVVAGSLLPGDVIPPGLLVGAAAVPAVAVPVVLPTLRYRRWRYRIRPHDVHLRYGVLWHVERTVPRRRIQHVDVTAGPLERALGLSSVKLYTAGTREADARVPGLRREVAEGLRTELLRESG